MNNRETAATVLTPEQAGNLMRQATPGATLQHHLEGRARLIASVEKMRKAPTASRSRHIISFAFGTAITAAVLFFVRARTPTPIAWRVENGPAGAYVSIPPTAPSARLVFNDGSDVALAPGSRGRVAATTPVGAEVVLEQGQARVHVVHRDRTSWRVDAGPFEVQVTGTDFLVAWAADAETLDVWMHAGRVVVRGPVLGDAQPLAAGQHLRARLRDGTVQIDSLSEAAEETSAPAYRPSTVDAKPVATAVEMASTNVAPGPGTTPSGVSAAAPQAWAKLVAMGDFGRIVKEAEVEGVGHAIGNRPLADLRALGDASRYAKNAAVAKRTYIAIRSRFASSADARVAAFLLGRIAEENDRENADAIRWYDVYLAEAPGGAFAGDALGRKMILVSKSQGRESARSLADRYLQRFPSGPYAAAARDLSP